MTAETPGPDAAPQPAGQTRKRDSRSPLWLGAAALVFLLAIVLLAMGLGSLLRGGGLDEGPDGHFLDRAESAIGAGDLPDPADALSPDEAQDRLRRLMAGLLMAATEAETEAEYDHPDNQTPEGRRRFLAEALGVRSDYPRGAVDEALIPDGVEVLAVFDHPATDAVQMVLCRVPGDVQSALERFYDAYTHGQGWQITGPKEAGSDRGWLLEMRRGSDVRVVYALERASGKETLVALYDSRY